MVTRWRFSAASAVARIGSWRAKIGSSAVLRAMLLSVICGTVRQSRVSRLPFGPPLPSAPSIQVPFGLRATSSALSARSR